MGPFWAVLERSWRPLGSSWGARATESARMLKPGERNKNQLALGGSVETLLGPLRFLDRHGAARGRLGLPWKPLGPFVRRLEFPEAASTVTRGRFRPAWGLSDHIQKRSWGPQKLASTHGSHSCGRGRGPPPAPPPGHGPRYIPDAAAEQSRGQHKNATSDTPPLFIYSSTKVHRTVT